MAITITNSAGNKLRFTGVDNVQDRHASSNIDISAPGQSASSTTVINLSGLTVSLSVFLPLMGITSISSSLLYSSRPTE